MRRAFIGFLALAALAGVWSVANPVFATPPSKAELSRMLAGFEQTPGADDFRAWGPETFPILVELYDDRDMQPFVRMRAVGAVAHYPSPRARAFLLRVARADGQSDLLVRAAVRGLGRAFGPRAVEDVRPFLRHRAPAVREGAVLALTAIHTPAAQGALRARLPREQSAHIAERIRASLSANPR
ncbi:MAG: HEAT repeat domain-containing protein [Deltaproteobacteria bacterium]|nr:HEAT repeat domain-containing protein [Deltaproteobacteria bacterium]